MKKSYYFVNFLLIGASCNVSAGTISAAWDVEVNVVNSSQQDAIAKAIGAASSLVGAVKIATMQDVGTIDTKGYVVRSNVVGASILSAFYSNLTMSRSSQGKFFNGVSFTQRYSDKRGSADELVVVPNINAKKYDFFVGKKLVNSVPIVYAATDLAMLPYAFIGKPAPQKASFIAYTDGKAIRTTNLMPALEKIKLAGKEIDAVRLTGSSSGASVDLWVRASDSYPLRMRVGLNAQYGAVLDQRIREVPAANFML
jgi:hypothetical protein